MSGSTIKKKKSGGFLTVEFQDVCMCIWITVVYLPACGLSSLSLESGGFFLRVRKLYFIFLLFKPLLYWTFLAAAAAAAAKSLQSCPTLCDPIDGSPPGSPIPGILQVRTLE